MKTSSRQWLLLVTVALLMVAAIAPAIWAQGGSPFPKQGLKNTGSQSITSTFAFKMPTAIGAQGFLIERSDGTDILRFLDSGVPTFYNSLSVQGGINGDTSVTAPFYAGSQQALSGAGAINITTQTTLLTTTGANALSLANGAVGQRKTIYMVTDGGDGTLTPTTASGFSTITFNDAKDCVILEWTAAGWIVIMNAGTTLG